MAKRAGTGKGYYMISAVQRLNTALVPVTPGDPVSEEKVEPIESGR